MAVKAELPGAGFQPILERVTSLDHWRENGAASAVGSTPYPLQGRPVDVLSRRQAPSPTALANFANAVAWRDVASSLLRPAPV